MSACVEHCERITKTLCIKDSHTLHCYDKGWYAIKQCGVFVYKESGYSYPGDLEAGFGSFDRLYFLDR